MGDVDSDADSDAAGEANPSPTTPHHSPLTTHHSPTPPTHHSPLARTLRLTRKELSEVLRDRRTIVTLVAMPLLLYPLLSVAFLQFAWLGKSDAERGAKYVIGFERVEEARLF